MLISGWCCLSVKKRSPSNSCCCHYLPCFFLISVASFPFIRCSNTSCIISLCSLSSAEAWRTFSDQIIWIIFLKACSWNQQHDWRFSALSWIWSVFSPHFEVLVPSCFLCSPSTWWPGRRVGSSWQPAAWGVHWTCGTWAASCVWKGTQVKNCISNCFKCLLCCLEWEVKSRTVDCSHRTVDVHSSWSCLVSAADRSTRKASQFVVWPGIRLAARSPTQTQRAAWACWTDSAPPTPTPQRYCSDNTAFKPFF